MTIRRITISVPEKTARRIRRAAAGMPVSAWVSDVIEDRLETDELERLWEAFCKEVAPTRQEERRAAAMFKRLVKKPRGRKAA